MRGKPTLLLRSLGITAMAAGLMVVPMPANAQSSGTYQNSAQNARQKKLNDVARLLNLTPQQKTKADQIFSQAWSQAQPLLPQLHKTRQEIRQLIESGSSSNFGQRLNQLSNREAQLISQMITIRAKAMGHFYDVLKPNQKTQAASLYDLLTTHFPFRLRVVPAEPGATGFTG